jgi:hypothetical protein
VQFHLDVGRSLSRDPEVTRSSWRDLLIVPADPPAAGVRRVKRNLPFGVGARRRPVPSPRDAPITMPPGLVDARRRAPLDGAAADELDHEVLRADARVDRERSDLAGAQPSSSARK